MMPWRDAIGFDGIIGRAQEFVGLFLRRHSRMADIHAGSRAVWQLDDLPAAKPRVLATRTGSLKAELSTSASRVDNAESRTDSPSWRIVS